MKIRKPTAAQMGFGKKTNDRSAWRVVEAFDQSWHTNGHIILRHAPKYRDDRIAPVVFSHSDVTPQMQKWADIPRFKVIAAEVTSETREGLTVRVLQTEKGYVAVDDVYFRYVAWHGWDLTAPAKRKDPLAIYDMSELIGFLMPIRDLPDDYDKAVLL